MLPRDLREREARRHLSSCPSLVAKPDRRMSYARLLSFAEAREVLAPLLGHPEGDERAKAQALLIASVLHDRGALADALANVRARKFEQDPVRRAMIGALAALPLGRFAQEHLEAVGAVAQDALDGPALQQHKTDGHLDIDAVRAGAVLVCPVKVPGGGVYLGDMHAMQGDGEIAGHTADVAGTVTLQVEVIKGLGIDGPVLFPLAEDLPFLAKPLTAEERAHAEMLAAREGVAEIEESWPISVIGTGPDLNSATDNGLRRAAELLGMSVPEVMNRATISGAIEIGRAPGVVQVTFRAPAAALEAAGLLSYALEQYA